ncbi:hypothetical protein RJT34_13322 [Clitoria ternatea]|uniref:DUF4283 domain-containing protein n=1 Tax=Clitoria ternatea TaxID=43366 RepID=A0AAN9PM70_CLITE
MYLVVLKELSADETPAETSLTVVLCWIGVYELPLNLRTERIARVLGNSMRSYVEWDGDDDHRLGTYVCGGKEGEVVGEDKAEPESNVEKEGLLQSSKLDISCVYSWPEFEYKAQTLQLISSLRPADNAWQIWGRLGLVEPTEIYKYIKENKQLKVKDEERGIGIEEGMKKRFAGKVQGHMFP